MILTYNQITEIKGAIASALAQLYKQDKCLIKNKTHERAIVFRFGLYFSKIIENTSFSKDAVLSIDVEYNRNLYNIKKMKGSIILPDLILHQRDSNDRNIVVIEFKGHWNQLKGDKEKLKEFTNQSGDYQYGLGVSIKLGLDINKCEIVYYKNGDIELLHPTNKLTTCCLYGV
jgi:hypothetical protein